MTEEFHYENYRAQYIQSSDNNNVVHRKPVKGDSGDNGEQVDQLLHEKDKEVCYSNTAIANTALCVVVHHSTERIR